MIASFRPRPVVLCVLDGWGVSDEARDNAILAARTPVWDRLMATCPHSVLEAAGEAVGLPAPQMGNSEVGHLNLGAGRVVLQELPRIDRAVADGSLEANPAFDELIRRLEKSGARCHLMGLMSPGGVHSHQEHLVALARILSARGVTVAVHAFLDGRDTPPRSSRGYLNGFQEAAAGERVQVATVIGRYYAMDRDERWDRTERAFETIVCAEGESAASADAAIAQSYRRGLTDEFVLPTVIGDYAGIQDGDGLLMANFRADRVRQILTALLDPDFEAFDRRATIRLGAASGMVPYSVELDRFLKALFPPPSLRRGLGEVLADHGLRQLRIAETEKYAHVSYFFNGGFEEPLPGEERVLVPSPKVATYDLKPEMSAFEVTDRLVSAVGKGGFDFILVNYANPDMVGHTGDFAATTRAIEAVDACLGRLCQAVEAADGALLITADHGNAERMRDHSRSQAHTAHTPNPVPCVLVGVEAQGVTVRDGRLADVAPTVLDLLDLPQPAEMTGESLIQAAPAALARRARA